MHQDYSPIGSHFKTRVSLTPMLLLASLVSTVFGLALLGTAFGALSSRQTTPTISECSALHIIVARASLESQGGNGEGQIGAVATDVCSKTDGVKVSGCDSYGIIYPATLDNYPSSVENGTATMTSVIKAYYASCPSTPLVLMGYSQGGEVVGDVICGTSEAGWATTAPLTGSVTDNIVAVIQMADPAYVYGLPFNVGNATKDGVLPRQDTAACDPFASRIQSYCDANDIYCASGNSRAVHVGYVPEYGSDATHFVISKYSSYTSAKAVAAATTSTTATSSTASAGDSRRNVPTVVLLCTTTISLIVLSSV